VANWQQKIKYCRGWERWALKGDYGFDI
jgi:hypothetical protein